MNKRQRKKRLKRLARVVVGLTGITSRGDVFVVTGIRETEPRTEPMYYLLGCTKYLTPPPLIVPGVQEHHLPVRYKGVFVPDEQETEEEAG